MLPSLERAEKPMNKPRILVLEVRDKKQPHGPVVAQIVVEREETFAHYADGQLKQACIELSFRQIGGEVYAGNGRGEFHGTFSPVDNSVSLTTHREWGHGFVTLDLPQLEGQRIGTYLMNEIVAWARQWPDADVRPVQLLSGQADPRNKDRRNRFYERFGLVFEYADSERRAGMSRPMKVRELQAVNGWQQNISERRVFDFLDAEQLAQLRSHAECRILERSVRDLNRQLSRAEDHPVLWAAVRTFKRIVG